MPTIKPEEERSINLFIEEVQKNQDKSDTPIADEISKAIAKAKKTGERIQMVFSKEDIKKEDIFQQLLNDPRTVNFSKDQVRLDVAPLEEILVDDLCDICLKAGVNNPIAMEQIKSLQHNGRPFPGDVPVCISKGRLNDLKAAAKANDHTGVTTSIPKKSPPIPVAESKPSAPSPPKSS